jgi:tRNA-2-methylthio-N6-dimethylallyladenosine synthase
MRRYYIKTYGCQMNLADSQRLARVLEAAGYEGIGDARKADLVLINTCVVRQQAEDRAHGYITSLSNELKAKKPAPVIGVCGCLVTEPGKDLREIFPRVDFFIPPHSTKELEEFLASTGTPQSFAPMICGREKGIKVNERHAGEVYINIMCGCDNFCSYCVVPYVRGREESSPMAEVLEEIKLAVQSGARDITLLGQNVNSYKYGLAGLLREIETVMEPATKRRGSNCEEPRRSVSGSEQVFKIHFLTSHPKDLSDDIIRAVFELPYVKKEFIVPAQSGDNEILRKMNRGYTVERYLDMVGRIRALMPKARIVSDLMVGFPGETEEQFQNTLRLVERVKFSAVNMFAYSSRPGTAAAGFPGQLPDEVKQERLKRLNKLVKNH